MAANINARAGHWLVVIDGVGVGYWSGLVIYIEIQPAQTLSSPGGVTLNTDTHYLHSAVHKLCVSNMCREDATACDDLPHVLVGQQSAVISSLLKCHQYLFIR